MAETPGDRPPTYTEATAAPAGAVGGGPVLTQPGYTSPSGSNYNTNYGPQPPPTDPNKPDQYQRYPAGSYQSGAAPGVYPGPPGYQPVGQQPPYASGTVIAVQQPSVVVVGGCPACRIGVLEDDFTFLGVCCAILFFPIGILCCLAMRQRHCPNCGAVFS